MKYRKLPNNNKKDKENENIYHKQVKSWEEDGYTVIRVNAGIHLTH